MASILHYYYSSSKDGPYLYGSEPGWDWTRFGGDYHKKRDFFSVHWEICEKYPLRVKLHIESPVATVDEELNGLKARVVQEFLSASFQHLAAENGLAYHLNGRVQPHNIRGSQSTQAFRIDLTPDQKQPTLEENIASVNRILGGAVDHVMSSYRRELEKAGLQPRK